MKRTVHALGLQREAADFCGDAPGIGLHSQDASPHLQTVGLFDHSYCPGFGNLRPQSYFRALRLIRLYFQQQLCRSPLFDFAFADSIDS